MWSIHEIANFASIIGTCCGLFSRVPQVYRTYKTKSANDLSTNTMVINITANTCFLFYMIVNEQYPIVINCLSIITLEGSLIYMKNKFGKIKKSSSQTDLSKMNKDKDKDKDKDKGKDKDKDKSKVNQVKGCKSNDNLGFNNDWKYFTNMFRTTSRS